MVGLFPLASMEARKLSAWAKASAVPGRDPNHIRRDAFGWLIVWSEYGDRQSVYGWEVDHAQPTILGGASGHSNLRALHWRNNASLGGLLGGLRRRLDSNAK